MTTGGFEVQKRPFLGGTATRFSTMGIVPTFINNEEGLNAVKLQVAKVTGRAHLWTLESV